jgi:hypothetical protein
MSKKYGAAKTPGNRNDVASFCTKNINSPEILAAAYQPRRQRSVFFRRHFLDNLPVNQFIALITIF